MFFWEDEVDQSIIWRDGSLESKGNYSPHNLDINWTYFNVFNEKSYSRWRFHFILVSFLLILISSYYPLLFMIVFMDWYICTGASISDVEWMTEDYFYDYTDYLAQMKGGDIRLEIYVFAFYDRLGYVIYGFSDIGEDYCDDLFEYNNFFGLTNNLQNYISPLKLDDEFNSQLNPINKKNILNNFQRYFYIYRNSDLINISRINNRIIGLLRDKQYLNQFYLNNYHFFYNNDRALTWLEYNSLLKELGKYKI